MKKRADGRYEAKIYIGREDGIRKYCSVYANTPAELKTKEAEVRHKLGKGIDILSGRDSFAQWADDWLVTKEVAPITDKQKDKYRRSVRLWKASLAGLSIDQVRTDDIERVLLQLQRDGKAQDTINFNQRTIRQIMDRAVGRAISVNPERLVRLTKKGRAEEKRRALTDEEQRWIWDTPGRGQAVAIIMMLSGLRRGELAALTWADVDLKKRTITVNKTVEYLSDGTWELRPFAKSASSMRVVDIPQRLADYMAQMPRNDFLVIQKAGGGTMTESAWVKLWRSYMRTLNAKYGTGLLKDQDRPEKPGPKTYVMTIPHITLHWLRHTFCTLMYLAGVDVVTASKQMGHADVATTLRIYTHLDTIHKRKSIDKLDAYLDDRTPSSAPILTSI